MNGHGGFAWWAAFVGGPAGLQLAWTWAFLEAILLPLPPEILLIPMTIARPDRAWPVAVMAVVGSLTGGLVSYALARAGGERTVTVLKRLPGVGPERVLWARTMIKQRGSRFIAVSPWLVLPYKITSVVSGHLRVVWWRYLLAGALGRGTRLISLALVVAIVSAQSQDFVQGHPLVAAMLAYVAVAAAVYGIRHGLRWVIDPA